MLDRLSWRDEQRRVLTCLLCLVWLAAAPPYVVDISPLFAGPGEVITVMGDGFVNSSLLGCRFGNVPAQAVMWVSETEVRCTVPSSASGAVTVQVTSNGQRYVFASMPLFVRKGEA